MPKRLLQPADHPHRQQGVAAEFEEVIVAAHPVQLEHFGPDARPAVFDLALRRLVAARAHRHRFRGGQRLAVQLAVGRQGQHSSRT